MILTEAMAARRPFVSTPTGGTPDLAPGGILVPVEDEDALASAIVELLADAQRARDMGQAGQDLCRDTRSVEVIDRRLSALYGGAAEGERR
jgi:glycosyltransferase involved in cell wall biosynthesis